MPARNDFARLQRALFLDGKPDRVPLIELYVDDQVKSAYLGRPVRGLRDEVDFWISAGYDYVPISLGLIEVGGVLSGDAAMVKCSRYSIYTDEEVEMKWAAEHGGVITSMEDFKRFNWPAIGDMDFSKVTAVAAMLPDEMGIIVVIGKVFTAVWMLMGMESFALATIEQPDLVQVMFDRVAEIQTEVLSRAVSLPRVRAAWMSDDVAFATSLMVNPSVLRDHLFPRYRQMAHICGARGLPFIYHSDGNLWEVLDDLTAVGFNALHPVEPKAMDIRELKKKVEGKLCLLGNIEVDRLARGTPDEVRQLARANIRDLAYDGGYCLGSSNSVTSYCRVENYRAMIETVFE